MPEILRRIEVVVGRVAVLGYGLFSYVCFLAAFVYAIGFIAGVGVPRGIDMASPLGELGPAAVIDLALLACFAVQHSVMARPWFKTRWVKIIPASTERSTYVLVTSILFGVLFVAWHPIPTLVWQVPDGLATSSLWALCGLGWLLVLVSTFSIDHFELFGLKQALDHYRGVSPRPGAFKTPMLYKLVRHPIMVGFVIAFWAAPRMSWGHLLFAAATTGYILIAIQLEERDLVAHFGESYREYQRQVPQLIPGL